MASAKSHLQTALARACVADNLARSLFASGIAYGSEAVASREGSEKSILHLEDQRFEHFDLATDPEERRPLEDDGRTMRADVLAVHMAEFTDPLLIASCSACSATCGDTSIRWTTTW